MRLEGFGRFTGHAMLPLSIYLVIIYRSSQCEAWSVWRRDLSLGDRRGIPFRTTNSWVTGEDALPSIAQHVRDIVVVPLAFIAGFVCVSFSLNSQYPT